MIIVTVEPPHFSCSSFSLSSSTWIATLSPTSKVVAFCCSKVASPVPEVDDAEEAWKWAALLDVDDAVDEVVDETGRAVVPAHSH